MAQIHQKISSVRRLTLSVTSSRRLFFALHNEILAFKLPEF
jgi:hypothetical protein